MSASLMLPLTVALAAYNAVPSTFEVPQLNMTDIIAGKWWGPADKQANQDTAIHCSRITYEDDMIEDLKMRLRKTKTNIQPLEGAKFFYGFNQKNIGNWTDFWLNKYDFKAQEEYWNKFPLYKTNIQGIDISFYRITPEVNENIELVPLMVLHGWPTSPLDFFDAIPLLTEVNKERGFAFDLIVPFLPGYGPSEGAVRPGLGAVQMAVVMRNLMQRIGYKKFYVQGGDFGARVLVQMVTLYPEEVLGYHTNWGILISPVAIFLQLVGELSPSLVRATDQVYNRMYPTTALFNGVMEFTGYMHTQSTRPDSIGVGLSDSPIGLLSYMLEKYSAWIDNANVQREDGGLLQSYDPNFLINSVMLFWSTNSFTTSMRLYSNHINKHDFGLRIDEIPTSVPLWFMAPAQELSYQGPVILSLKYKNILGETILDKGSHFFPHQYPEIFAENVFEGVTAFRKWHVANGTDTKYIE